MVMIEKNRKYYRAISISMVCMLLTGIFSISGLPEIKVAAASTVPIYSENFESYTGTDAANLTSMQAAGWTVTPPQSSGTLSATIDSSTTGTNSTRKLKLSDSSTTDSIRNISAQKSFAPQTGIVTISYDFLVPATGLLHKMRIMSGSTIVIDLWDSDSQNGLHYIDTYNTSAYNTYTRTKVTSLTANTWYNVKIIANFSTKKFDIYINDVLKLANVNFSSSNLRAADSVPFGPSSPITSIDGVRFETSGSKTGNMSIDNISVSSQLPIYTNSSISGSDNVVNMNFDRNIVSNVPSVKDSVYFAADGTNFMPLTSGDSASIIGKQLTLNLANSLTGTNNKFKILGNALKDSDGNVVTDVVITEAIGPDHTPPSYLSAAISNRNKTVTLSFSENISSNISSVKDAIYLSTYGTPFYPLISGDTVTISGSNMIINFVNPLPLGSNMIRVDANSLMDGRGNILQSNVLTASISPLQPAFSSSSVSNDNKEAVLSFTNNLASNIPNIKSAVMLQKDGRVFYPLSVSDSVYIAGDKVVVDFNTPLSGSGNKIKIVANNLKDDQGIVVSSDTIATLTLPGSDKKAPLYSNSSVSNLNKTVTLNFDETVVSNVTPLKNSVTFAQDGSTFASLGGSDTASISGNKLVISFNNVISGSSNKVKIAANALKDSSGNVLSSITTTEAIVADESAPTLLNVIPDAQNKSVILKFNEDIIGNIPNIKDGIYFAQDGNIFSQLNVNDAVILGDKIFVSLNSPMTGGLNKVKIAGSTIKDGANNILVTEVETSLLSAFVPVYPYPQPHADVIAQALTDSSSILFSNDDSGGNFESTSSFAAIAMALSAGSQEQVLVDRFVNVMKAAISDPSRMPALTGSLDARTQYNFMFALALNWNNQYIMSRFTETEKSKLILLAKAALVAGVYVADDYLANGSVRDANRPPMDGNNNNWVGGNPNYSEPIMGYIYTGSFILGLQNAKAFIQNYDHAAFLAELQSQGLTSVYTKWTLPGLSPNATTVEGILKSPYWSFRGVTLNQIFADPMKMYTNMVQFTFDNIAADGDYIGQYGMMHEFLSSDSAGHREAAHYAVYGADPSLLSKILMKYFGFWDLSNDSANKDDAESRQKVGVSDYYYKVINGFFSQDWQKTATESTIKIYFKDLATQMGYLLPASFNDTFNYDGTISLLSSNWITNGGNWAATNSVIEPYNIHDTVPAISYVPNGTLTDPNEKVLKEDSNTSSAIAYTKSSWSNANYNVWLQFTKANEVGILGRVTDANNYLSLVYDNVNGKLAIRKKVSGVVTEILSKPYSLAYGTPYRFRGDFNGATIDFYINGVKELTATDSAFTQGAVGLLSSEADTKFDGIIVQNRTLEIPAAPVLNSIGLGNGQLTVKFSQATDALSYKIKYGTQPGVYTDSISNITSTSYSVGGLTNGTRYYFVVSSVKENGESVNSNELSLTPWTPTSVTPILQSLIPKDDSIVVNFTTDPMNTSYILKYGYSSGNYTKTITGISGTGYVLKLPYAQVPYYIVVEGTNEKGDGDNSNELFAAPNSNVLYSNNFETESLSGIWSFDKGNGEVVQKNGSYQLRGTTAFDRGWSNYGSTLKDYSISSYVTITEIDATKVPEVLLMGRFKDINNYYLMGYSNESGVTKLYIKKKLNSTTSILVSMPYTLQADTQYKFKGELVGSTIKFYLNDTQVLTTTDSSLTQGTYGILDTNNRPLYDDFVVTSLNVPAQPVISGATAASTSVEISYGTVPSATSYRIKYGNAPGKYTNYIGDVTETSKTVTGLLPNTTYYFAVSAYDSSNAFEGLNSSEYSITTPALIEPTVPDTQAPTWSSGSVSGINISQAGLTLNWSVASDNTAAVAYAIYKDGSLLTTLDNVTTYNVTGLTANTNYTFKVEAGDAAGNWSITGPSTAVTTLANANHGRTETKVPPVEEKVEEKKDDPKVTENNNNKGKTATVILDKAPTLDKISGVVQVTIDTTAINKAIEQAKSATEGDSMVQIKTLAIEIPKVEGAKAYEFVLPATLINTAEKTALKVELKTEVATLVMPPNMLKTADATLNATNVTLTMAAVSKAALNPATKAVIGDHPVIELNMKLDGKVTSWSNPNAPVSVSIPYKPSALELKNPEHIVVYYIDGKGNAIPVPSGKYDNKTGEVTFTTTHFSQYAVAYVEKTFDDIATVAWAKKEIEVLASKGIINGTSDTTFAPAANITRADFIVLLVKSLSLSTNIEDNFSDVKAEDYYYEALGIAKKLGISEGKGNNLFDPKAQISRQEMMTLTARAMKLVGKLTTSGSSADLASFSDKGNVAAYATDSISTLVKDGIVKGDGSSLNPLGSTTRAETAVLMYRIYIK